ncbi:MAG: hypothetical protein H6677_01105 [Candidatus Obscuribacterales bacterium]|nr:hypothetical protein [Candidatus Obscuribacterales bacterium]
MADKTPNTGNASDAAKAAEATRKGRTDKVLAMASDEVGTVHGNASAKAVSVTAALNVEETVGGKTVKDGAKATVALETTHEES